MLLHRVLRIQLSFKYNPQITTKRSQFAFFTDTVVFAYAPVGGDLGDSVSISFFPFSVYFK